MNIHAVHLPLRTRPPARGPVRRPVDPEVEATLRRWWADALQLSPDSEIRITEWKALDSRSPLPHLVHAAVVMVGYGRRDFVIAKASERILAHDVAAVVKARAAGGLETDRPLGVLSDERQPSPGLR